MDVNPSLAGQPAKARYSPRYDDDDVVRPALLRPSRTMIVLTVAAKIRYQMDREDFWYASCIKPRVTGLVIRSRLREDRICCGYLVPHNEQYTGFMHLRHKLGYRYPRQLLRFEQCSFLKHLQRLIRVGFHYDRKANPPPYTLNRATGPFKGKFSGTSCSAGKSPT